jgi:hypothetical protein
MFIIINKLINFSFQFFIRSISAHPHFQYLYQVQQSFINHFFAMISLQMKQVIKYFIGSYFFFGMQKFFVF